MQKAKSNKSNRHWVRKDYEKFVKTVTASWPAWKKEFLTK